MKTKLSQRILLIVSLSALLTGPAFEKFVDDDMEQSVIARIAKDLVADYISASAFEDVV